MIEPEMAFYDINDNMDLAEEMLKYLIRYALDNCMDDLQFLNNMYDKELISRLQKVADSSFKRITYTEAIEALRNSAQKFEFPPQWGSDLQKEHENYLVSLFDSPVIITGYPKAIKAFLHETER
jgi:Aspartyl/asparaginyl-tRNA synthetases